MTAIGFAGGLGLGALLLVASPACRKKAPSAPGTPARSPQPQANAEVLGDAIVAGAKRGMQRAGPKSPGKPEDCRGADLDLAKALSVQACAVDHDAIDRLPEGVGLRGPKGPLSVDAGGTLTIPMALENTTAKAVTVKVNANCGPMDVLRPEAYRDFDRADIQRSDRCVAESKACAFDTVGITIEPRGRAHIDVRYQAVVHAFDDACEVTKLVGPLPKGRYELAIFSRWHLPGANTLASWSLPLDVK